MIRNFGVTNGLFHYVSVDGGWSAFTSYSKCSKSCGLGKQERSRVCNNPIPAHGGEKCIGEDVQSKECKIKECPSMLNLVLCHRSNLNHY